jgi:hypothetical protein
MARLAIGPTVYSPAETGSSKISEDKQAIEELIRSKHAEYYFKYRLFASLYYLTRFSAVLCAGLLPFVVNSNTQISTGLSITVVVATAIDLVISPKDKFQLYSRASDLLALAQVKLNPAYKKNKEAIEVLLGTEEASVSKLTDLDEVLNKVRSIAELNKKGNVS